MYFHQLYKWRIHFCSFFYLCLSYICTMKRQSRKKDGTDSCGMYGSRCTAAFEAGKAYSDIDHTNGCPSGGCGLRMTLDYNNRSVFFNHRYKSPRNTLCSEPGLHFAYPHTTSIYGLHTLTELSFILMLQAPNIWRMAASIPTCTFICI